MAPSREQSDNFGTLLSADSGDIVDGGRQFQRLSAGTFDRLIGALADTLTALALPPSSRIALLGENSATYLALYFAIMRAGHIAAPLNHRLADDALHYILEDATVSLVARDEAFAGRVPAGYPAIRLDATAEQVVEELALSSPGHRPNDGSFAGLCKVLYTSGSTGRPKGVLLTHAGMRWALARGLEDLAGVQDETGLVVAPFYHKNGLYFSSLLLASGNRIVLLPRFSASAYLDAIVQQQCSWLTGVPTMFALLAKEEWQPRSLDHVKRINVGSAPLSASLLESMRRMFPAAAITNGYGTTEAGPAIFTRAGLGPEACPRALGRPVPGVEVRLVDGSPDEGILALRAPSMMRSYLNLPEETARAFRDGWLITGDIMRRDAEGLYSFVTRADDMFVCGGENIYPAAVESLLERCPGVAQAAVLPMTHETKGQVPVACIVRTPQSELTAEELKAWALAHGPAYAHPRQIVFRESLPMGTTLKVDKRRLAACFSGAAGSSAA